MNERIEIITKFLKALLPIAAALGYNLDPEQVQAIAYVLGGLLTLAYSAEAAIKFFKVKKNEHSVQAGTGNPEM